MGVTTLDDSGEKGIALLDPDYLLFDDPQAFLGTSPSAALVAGAVAMILEKNPSLDREEVENILHESADKIGDYPYENGRNDYYGYGKLDLSRALSLVPSF